MTTKNIQTMISLVELKFGEMSNEELISRIKEEFDVSISNTDILALHIDLSELEITNKQIDYYAGHSEYRQECVDY
jgi:hypothetical protein